jgi:hypothetical protein
VVGEGEAEITETHIEIQELYTKN